jgi:hypothetical protein
MHAKAVPKKRMDNIFSIYGYCVVAARLAEIWTSTKEEAAATEGRRNSTCFIYAP